jgi:hypothetical protein
MKFNLQSLSGIENLLTKTIEDAQDNTTTAQDAYS